MDNARDGKGVVAYVRRKSDNTLLGRIRDASGGGAFTTVYAPEGTVYTLQVCLDGGICGPRYSGKA